MSENGNGRWAMGFWIITVFTLIVGGAVIANDKVRASEDQRIELKSENREREQTKVNQDILLALSDIKSDVKVIRAEMKK